MPLKRSSYVFAMQEVSIEEVEKLMDDSKESQEYEDR